MINNDQLLIELLRFLEFFMFPIFLLDSKMAAGKVRLNVNGMNYEIIGVDESTSYKDILCTIVKQNAGMVCPENPKKFAERKTSMRKKRLPKSERKERRRESEMKEPKIMGDAKIIYVSSEKQVKQRKKPGKCRKTKDGMRIRSKDDSDVELHRKSKRRIKSLIEKKWRDESERKMYKDMIGGINYQKSNNLKTNAQNEKQFMDDFDKISIYYLNENSAMQNPMIEDFGTQGNSRSICSLLSETTTFCNMARMKSFVKPEMTDGKIGDDKDSGIPSWESEEISSRDDNKTGLKNYEKTSSINSPKEIFEHSIASKGLYEERKDGVERKISFTEKKKYDKEAFEDIKLEEIETIDGQNGTKICLMQNECINFTKRKEDDGYERTGEKKHKGESKSDFEIEKQEEGSVDLNTSIESQNNQNTNQEETFDLQNSIKDVDEQTIIIANDINSNELGFRKSSCSNEKKLNLDSFIIIELDETGANSKNGKNKMKFLSRIGQNSKEKEKKNSEVKTEQLGLEMGQQCSAPPVTFDRDKNEHEQTSNLGKKETGEQLMLQEEKKGKFEINIKDEMLSCRERLREDLGKEKVLKGKATCFERYNEGLDQNSNKEMKSGNLEETLNHIGDGNEKKQNNITECHEIRSNDLFCPNKETGGEETCETKLLFKSGKSCMEKNDEVLGGENQTGIVITTNGMDCSRKYSNDEGLKKMERLEERKEGLHVKKFETDFRKEIANMLRRKFNNYKKKKKPANESNENVGKKEEISTEAKKWKDNEKEAIWKEYVEVCEKICEILEKLLSLDLKSVILKIELDEIRKEEEFYNDDVLEKDEKMVVQDVIEFRKYLKYVTEKSKMHRMEMREYKKAIGEIEWILASKRSFLRSFEQLFIHDRYQKLPRHLMKRRYNMKKRQEGALKETMQS